MWDIDSMTVLKCIKLFTGPVSYLLSLQRFHSISKSYWILAASIGYHDKLFNYSWMNIWTEIEFVGIFDSLSFRKKINPKDQKWLLLVEFFWQNKSWNKISAANVNNRKSEPRLRINNLQTPTWVKLRSFWFWSKGWNQIV